LIVVDEEIGRPGELRDDDSLPAGDRLAGCEEIVVVDRDTAGCPVGECTGGEVADGGGRVPSGSEIGGKCGGAYSRARGADRARDVIVAEGVLDD